MEARWKGGNEGKSKGMKDRSGVEAGRESKGKGDENCELSEKNTS